MRIQRFKSDRLINIYKDMGKIRGTHSSPGIYTKFTDISYAAKTLGITRLGLVGETLKGPAFEPIEVKDFLEYQEYFGGTSAEKFIGSQYPKYELPYIAEEYLKASDSLQVCRVLGISGYNAGPAFLITAEKKSGDSNKKYVVAVLRPRGKYDKYGSYDPCSGGTYDTLSFMCDEITLSEYTNIDVEYNCEDGSADAKPTAATFDINQVNYGRFNIVCKKNGTQVGNPIPVSLNYGDKDYIYDVLGSNPTDNNSAPVFIEELYDLFLEGLIFSDSADTISAAATIVKEVTAIPIHDPVAGIVSIPESDLTKKELGLTYIYGGSSENASPVQYMEVVDGAICLPCGTKNMEIGGLYTVRQYVDTDGTTKYTYIPVPSEQEENSTMTVDQYDEDTTEYRTVKNYADGLFYVINKEGNGIMPLLMMSDYREQFRHAVTPWVVSELKGSHTQYEVKKLFRFHTITDGNCANEIVKISIANIRPDDGLFDVYVRDFNDGDGSMKVLESYKNLSMVPGTSNYIGLKIGTYNGEYSLKSKYVMVEVVENDMTEKCVPAGFLGYPNRSYSGVEAPSFKYNKDIDETRKPKRQYFGLSDITGVDIDMLSYKGHGCYNEKTYASGYTPAFHLDSRLSMEVESNGLPSVTIDGKDMGVKWETVSVGNITSDNMPPVIGSEYTMNGSIYEDINYRKFTLYPYGGFDGWDIYRESRTTSDEFTAEKYKGSIINGYGSVFSKIYDNESLALEGNCITSDFYAYLAAANQFEIPEKYVINLFATPGIDYVNDRLLIDKIFDMLEEKRGDTFYVVDTPDKPKGASDAKDEMYSSSDAVDNLEDSDLDTYYGSTYYPNVQYFDKKNGKYIYLHATKDVLRNMANVDNKFYPWYAPAGVERGNVNCEKMHFFAKLEDEDVLYDGRINPLKTFSGEGVKIWGNKTLYKGDSPMNRVNTVRLMLYMRKLIKQAAIKLIFEPNDATLKSQFESILNPILRQIKKDRGITDYRLIVSQTPEQMDAHEMSAKIMVRPTPVLEYLEIEFTITPQGVAFEDVQ